MLIGCWMRQGGQDGGGKRDDESEETRCMDVSGHCADAVVTRVLALRRERDRDNGDADVDGDGNGALRSSNV